ncbi:MAG TPA: ferrochelatase [Thermoanaerobaculia bacterium]|nr:ferrochelatase [Thermoanaerobaculia bacterium]
MDASTGTPRFRHGEIPAVGVLLANLGTPEAPTAAALRPYLRQFLSDPRVIELPAWKWQPILNLFVLTRRPRASAKLYAQVWTEEGSPLLVTSRRQRAGIEEILRREVGNPVHVALGMRYGEPSIAAALKELEAAGCRRILFLPLYPQYSATTTASTFDALAAEMVRRRWVPELRTIHGYHAEPTYLDALARSIREVWERDAAAGGTGEPERLLFSFHGIPLRYFRQGDPYHCFCHATARGVAERLGLGEERWVVAFQSRFGREEWLKPYTDKTVQAMARAGIATLDVVSPAFAADCLETLEELDGLNRELWHQAGGPAAGYRYLPCLNDRPDHLRLLADLVLRHLQGWTVPPDAWDEEAVRREAEETRRRAEAMAAAGAEEDAGYGRR